ncbi:hypothetical protein THICB1_20046 [Thiomonas arsenitoxydans]|uniref:Uncharacterized protein n=1 Tax=Thiomonas arsenitoxydans (strain DSM 22701 / CIP 110005 / 3As) TaxID=426114 RepID=A0ABM9T4U5_THIA3|nr:hypothetical protein THICB1_20046 [Thiomonas arsenitoxydans]
MFIKGFFLFRWASSYSKATSVRVLYTPIDW